MTKDFDVLNEQKIMASSSVESIFVNVGWGSYATQFKGSDGKRLTKAEVNIKIVNLKNKLIK